MGCFFENMACIFSICVSNKVIKITEENIKLEHTHIQKNFKTGSQLFVRVETIIIITVVCNKSNAYMRQEFLLITYIKKLNSILLDKWLAI